jgi:hypothetical protein
MLSPIVIESEGQGDPETMLRLSIDTHLIAQNLTIAHVKHLVCEILDRFDVFEILEDANTIEVTTRLTHRP